MRNASFSAHGVAGVLIEQRHGIHFLVEIAMQPGWRVPPATRAASMHHEKNNFTNDLPPSLRGPWAMGTKPRLQTTTTHTPRPHICMKVE